MANVSRNYDIKLNFANFAGIPVKGLADGTSITIKYNSEHFKYKIGGGGDVIRYRINDDTATVEITLLPDSETNDAFSAIAILDRKRGAGVGPFTLVDMAGRSKAVANNGWIQKMADLERGSEPQNVKWTIILADLELFVGGNS